MANMKQFAILLCVVFSLDLARSIDVDSVNEDIVNLPVGPELDEPVLLDRLRREYDNWPGQYPGMYKGRQAPAYAVHAAAKELIKNNPAAVYAPVPPPGAPLYAPVRTAPPIYAPVRPAAPVYAPVQPVYHPWRSYRPRPTHPVGPGVRKQAAGQPKGRVRRDYDNFPGQYNPNYPPPGMYVHRQPVYHRPRQWRHHP